MTAQQRVVQGLVAAPNSRAVQWGIAAARAYGPRPVAVSDLMSIAGLRYHAARAWCVRAEGYGWGVYRDARFYFSEDFLAFSRWLAA